MAPEFAGEFDPIELSDPALENDGLRHLTFYSPALRGRGDVSLFVPRGVSFPANIPLVLLLHGVYGSHWAWFLKGAAHLTAQALIDRGEIRPMILACPSDGLSGDGSGYWPRPERDAEQWITNDVPRCIRQQFPSTGPVFLSGLSMGGYGTLRLGFKYPDRFAALSAHSSLTRPEQMYDFVRDTDLRLDTMPAHEPEILHWATQNRSQLPPTRFDCGRYDSLFAANVALSSALADLQIPHTFKPFDGAHDWFYWSEHIADTLRFFNACCR